MVWDFAFTFVLTKTLLLTGDQQSEKSKANPLFNAQKST